MTDARSKTMAIVCTDELYNCIQGLMQSSDNDNAMVLLLRAYKQLKPLLGQLKEGTGDVKGTTSK
jgi:hypothetical protein